MVNKVDHYCNQITRIIHMSNNILLFSSSLPCCFVEVVIDVVTLPSCILKHKTIISSTSMCYAKYHYIYIYIIHFKKLLILANNVMLPINGRETSEPLGHLV